MPLHHEILTTPTHNGRADAKRSLSETIAAIVRPHYQTGRKRVDAVMEILATQAGQSELWRRHIGSDRVEPRGREGQATQVIDLGAVRRARRIARRMYTTDRRLSCGSGGKVIAFDMERASHNSSSSGTKERT
ncbi:hypothetical protein [Antrihabitans sp. YC2-6]|uniref:hypothetical protein n=1 Tax=Antrihabitans sp. YC2-6 TaxID=2799498 RepID=UPI0018F41649|nr:hypothetical protein [Antrihabitans sp. YC2-6]MBJ8346991.1 hypothetical protein [Antrihabitans sp. YC2-6]